MAHEVRRSICGEGDIVPCPQYRDDRVAPIDKCLLVVNTRAVARKVDGDCLVAELLERGDGV